MSRASRSKKQQLGKEHERSPRVDLFHAVSRNSPEHINDVLAAGVVDIDDNSPHSGDTALLHAIKFNKTKAVRTLIAGGADVTKSSTFNETQTPICVAVFYQAHWNDVAILELLEEHISQQYSTPDVDGFVADMGALAEQGDVDSSPPWSSNDSVLELNPESLLDRLIGSDPDAISVDEMLSDEGIALLQDWMVQ